MQGSSVRLTLAMLALGVLGLQRPDVAHAQDAVYEPAAVKAAFIYHFSTFVNWPEPPSAGQSFIISVMGDDEIARQLEQYLPGRRIGGRGMEVLRVDSVDDLGHTDVLFIGRERAGELEESAEALRDRPVLVVSDTPEGLDRGAMINFMILDRHVRFEISIPAAERAGLSLSSRLLSAAQHVRTTHILMEPPSPLSGWAFKEWIEKGIRALLVGKRAVISLPAAPYSGLAQRHARCQSQGHHPSQHVEQCVQFWENLPMVSWPVSPELGLPTLRIDRTLIGDFRGVQIRMALAVPTGQTVVGMHDLG